MYTRQATIRDKLHDKSAHGDCLFSLWKSVTSSSEAEMMWLVKYCLLLLLNSPGKFTYFTRFLKGVIAAAAARMNNRYSVCRVLSPDFITFGGTTPE